jgi:LDH2 family malate/lactate/ureidoglycolate dehydrogenase
MTKSQKKTNPTKLKKFVSEIFLFYGFSKTHALLCAEVLVEADLRGIDSHGIARLEGYVRLIENKRINPNPNFSWVKNKGAVATPNADSAIGLVSAPFAMKEAIKKAKKYGCGFVSIQNSNHFGIAGYHAELASKNELIGLAMTNASPLVSPPGTNKRMLGTNPIAIAIPNPHFSKYPFLLDMATSAAANGKLEIAQREGKQIPNGWISMDGEDSTDPFALKEGASLLPLGSDLEHGSHKGFGLSAFVDIFTGVLSGANFGPWVPPFVAFLDPLPNLPGKGLGHFVGAWNPDFFGDKNDFFNQMKIWSNEFSNAPKSSEQGVIIPGQPEFTQREKRLVEGIFLNDIIYESLVSLAQKTNLKFKI